MKPLLIVFSLYAATATASVGPELRSYSGWDFATESLCELDFEGLDRGLLRGILRIHGKNHEFQLERGGPVSFGPAGTPALAIPRNGFAYSQLDRTVPIGPSDRFIQVAFNSRGRALRYVIATKIFGFVRRECELDP